MTGARPRFLTIRTAVLVALGAALATVNALGLVILFQSNQFGVAPDYRQYIAAVERAFAGEELYGPDWKWRYAPVCRVPDGAGGIDRPARLERPPCAGAAIRAPMVAGRADVRFVAVLGGRHLGKHRDVRRGRWPCGASRLDAGHVRVLGPVPADPAYHSSFHWRCICSGGDATSGRAPLCCRSGWCAVTLVVGQGDDWISYLLQRGAENTDLPFTIHPGADWGFAWLVVGRFLPLPSSQFSVGRGSRGSSSLPIVARASTFF